MEENLQQKIERRLAELPEDVQAAIASSEFDEKLNAIGKAQGLHIDQMEALGDEVMLAMLGFIKLDDLPHGIERQVRVSSAQAQAITDAVNKEIFLSIRESMKAWAAGRREEEAPTPTSAALAPSAEASSPSVVMPSSPKPATPPTLTPAVAPITAPLASQSSVSVPKPAATPNLEAAEAILSEKKVTPPAPAPTTTSTPITPAAPATPAASPMPQVDPAQPQNYKADPYREPVE